MSSNHAAMEAALLEIAKDLLQASDDLASTDPSASAKLAREAYEIGRDLGIVRNHVDDDAMKLLNAVGSSIGNNGARMVDQADGSNADDEALNGGHQRNGSEDDSDAGLLRILDRQKAMLPKPVELAPVRKPSRSSPAQTFESVPRRRSGWFGWMRSREWRHAG